MMMMMIILTIVLLLLLLLLPYVTVVLYLRVASHTSCYSVSMYYGTFHVTE